MKILKNLIIIAGLIVLLANIAYAPGSSNSASSAADSYYVGCALNVSLVNQNPYPAQPDSYVDVVFQVNWLQNYVCNGSRFELIPSYPFSLDGNDSLRVLPDDLYIQSNKEDWMIPYKLRVDKDALDGNNEIEVRYSPGLWENGTLMYRKFNISVQDARTMFDAVLQEIQGSEVSIAIANAGKYAANSVVVRIPEQEDFMVTGTDGQMVGNLESGDYTVVGFSISEKFAQAGLRNASQQARPREPGMINMTSSKKLKFDIYYTDNIGERRVVNMEVPYSTKTNLSMMGNSSMRRNGNFQGATGSNSSKSSGTFLIIAIVCIVAVLIIYLKFFRHPGKKREELLRKGRSEEPEWVRSAKARERKK